MSDNQEKRPISTENSKVEKKVAIVLLLAVATLIFANVIHDQLFGSYSTNNEMALHNIFELFTVFMSFYIAIQGWSIYPYKMSKRQLLFSALFFSVGLINFMHIITQEGMPYFLAPNSFIKSSWFLFTARITEAIGIFLILLLQDNILTKVKRKRILVVSLLYVITTIWIVISFEQSLITLDNYFGYTNIYTKILYFISIIHFSTIILVVYTYKKNKSKENLYLILALGFLLISDLIFNFFTTINNYDLDNLLGHLYKLIGYYYLFRVIYVHTVLEPFKLKQIAEKVSFQNFQSLKWVIELIPGAFQAVDHQFNIIVANQAAKEVLGFKNDENIIGKNLVDIMKKQGQDINQFPIAKSVKYGTVCSREKIEYNGKIYLTENSPIIDAQSGKIHGAVWYYFNISEEEQENKQQKKLIEKYFNQTKNLQQLIESIPIAFIAVDGNGDVILINKRMLHFLKYENKEDILGKQLKDSAKRLHIPTDKIFIYRALNGETIVNERYQLLDLDLLVNAYPIKDNDNRIIGAISLFQDVTELEVLRNEMGNMERLNLIGQMAASITHEIRNPMATIRGFIQLLKEGPEGKINDYYKIIIDEIDRANVIISDFLSLSQTRVLKMKETNLKELLQEIYQILIADANINGQYAELQIKGNLQSIQLNEREIKQLIINLARNGIEAMSQGGVLTIKAEQKEDKIEIQVKDTGVGIPKENLDNLFKPFYTTKDGGTGLGLSVSKSIVEKHKGDIFVESTEGIGTTFTILLPI